MTLPSKTSVRQHGALIKQTVNRAIDLSNAREWQLMTYSESELSEMITEYLERAKDYIEELIDKVK